MSIKSDESALFGLVSSGRQRERDGDTVLFVEADTTAALASLFWHIKSC